MARQAHARRRSLQANWGQTPIGPSRAIPKLTELRKACAQNLRERLTAAVALGRSCPFRWCPFLWRLFLWRPFLQCLYAAPGAACYALPAVPSPAPCEHCVAPYAGSYDWCAGPDVVPWHRCVGPDVVPCHRGVGPGLGPGLGLGLGPGLGLVLGPGAAPRQAFAPQHLMLSAPRLAFLCQTPRLLPKLQAFCDERS